MARWLRFCKNKIEKIEKIWNRKLEDARDDDENASDEASDDSHDDGPSTDDPFGLFKHNDALSRSMIINRSNDEASNEIKSVIDGMLPAYKDDTDLNIITKDFNQHEFWKLESTHSIDDLMAELDD